MSNMSVTTKIIQKLSNNSGSVIPIAAKDTLSNCAITYIYNQQVKLPLQQQLAQLKDLGLLHQYQQLIYILYHITFFHTLISRFPLVKRYPLNFTTNYIIINSYTYFFIINFAIFISSNSLSNGFKHFCWILGHFNIITHL